MEVEIKFRYREGVEEKVSEMAEFVIEKYEYDVYFNHPCRDFRETDEAVRIRKDVEGINITYKGPKIDSETKSREEIKLKVEDFDMAFKLLEKLGFTRVMEVKKLRKIYRLGDAIICIDDVEGLGRFVEFELESDNIMEKQKLFSIAESLGYRRGDAIRESYLELILQEKSG
ncbi:class IV adenylate cyclase [Archaeoglobus neptunius]|uniref:class IV adenylate cyclase n=1 Tax=Archaeoglobus neptunius TaxID=2798580 RepID=UPI001925B168|nr:class IV adenylate cyclase [Archaeoglobus neptunius]